MTYSIQNRYVFFRDLGLIPYKQAWDIQETYLKETIEMKLRIRDRELSNEGVFGALSADADISTPNYLLFCEHPHVYTLGKSGKETNLLLDFSKMESIGAEYIESNRGGDITYHGPGQLVVYPVLDLENFFTDIHRYMRSLEEIVIKTCAHFGLETGRVPGLTGVWVDPKGPFPRKICAMGVKTSRWVSMHGLALNVTTDMVYFGHIVPCGIQDKSVTSLSQELDSGVSMEMVKTIVREKFCEVFGAELTELS